LAAASLGVASYDRVRAQVTSSGFLNDREDDAAGSWRLIVQTYAPDDVGADGLPSPRARPLASTQRSATGAELERGMQVDVVHLGEASNDGTVLVAWLERGQPDLEYDGRTARPNRAVYTAVAQTDHGSTPRLVLRRTSEVEAA
jgi:hypothetical protein